MCNWSIGIIQRIASNRAVKSHDSVEVRFEDATRSVQVSVDHEPDWHWLTSLQRRGFHRNAAY
jgi:hypothetical protein